MNICVWFSFEWGRQFIFSCCLNQGASQHTNRDTLFWCVLVQQAFFFPFLSSREVVFKVGNISVLNYGAYARENEHMKFHDNHSTSKCIHHGRHHT